MYMGLVNKIVYNFNRIRFSIYLHIYLKMFVVMDFLLLHIILNFDTIYMENRSSIVMVILMVMVR
jgi:hypothetical protein